MDDADDLEQAVAGFRRAEAALATVVAGADRLVEAGAEVEQARDELKVVAGALVGLATAHRDLVRQLGEAAAALHPAHRGENDNLVVALRDAEDARSRQVAELAEAVEELARRLDRALADRIEGLAGAEQVADVAALVQRLPATSDLEALERRLVEILLTEAPPAGGPPIAEAAELAATRAASVVEEQVSRLLEQVEASQRSLRLLVLAVGMSFLLFAAVVSVLALR